MQEPSPWVKRHASAILPGGTVLDVAAGSGRHTRYLNELGYRVVAVDVDASKLESFRKTPGIEVVEADLEGGPWPFRCRRFDGVVVTNYLHRPLFPVLAESLAGGGALIYETFARGHERYGRPSNPDFLLREDELRNAFGAWLTIVEHEQVFDSEPRPSLKQRLLATKPA